MIGDDFAGAMHKATEDGSLMVPVLAHTLLACLTPEGANDQEKAYLKALHSAVAFRLVENRLELQNATGETILVFTRQHGEVVYTIEPRRADMRGLTNETDRQGCHDPVLIFLGSLLAGCTPDVSNTAEYTLVPTAAVGNVTRQDTNMVGGSGDATQEAIQPANLHELIASLQADLTQYEPDTFARLWVQNEPEYRIFVAFTRDGQETIRKYVEDTPLAGMVEVRSADFTLAELLPAGEEVGQIVRELGSPFTWMVDVQKNRVELLVADRALFEAALKDAGLELSQCVEMIVTYEHPIRPPPASLLYRMWRSPSYKRAAPSTLICLPSKENWLSNALQRFGMDSLVESALATKVAPGDRRI